MPFIEQTHPAAQCKHSPITKMEEREEHTHSQKEKRERVLTDPKKAEGPESNSDGIRSGRLVVMNSLFCCVPKPGLRVGLVQTVFQCNMYAEINTVGLHPC